MHCCGAFGAPPLASRIHDISALPVRSFGVLRLPLSSPGVTADTSHHYLSAIVDLHFRLCLAIVIILVITIAAERHPKVQCTSCPCCICCMQMCALLIDLYILKKSPGDCNAMQAPRLAEYLEASAVVYTETPIQAINATKRSVTPATSAAAAA